MERQMRTNAPLLTTWIIIIAFTEKVKYSLRLVMTRDTWEQMKGWQALSIKTSTIHFVTVRSSNKKSTLANKTKCKGDSPCWRNMLRSSKILTCRSSYICKWRRIKITWEAIKIRATFLALVVNLIQVVEYRPSGVVHQWMEHMIMEFQLKNSLLVTLLARWSGVKKNLMKIYKICTTVSQGQLR